MLFVGHLHFTRNYYSLTAIKGGKLSDSFLCFYIYLMICSFVPFINFVIIYLANLLLKRMTSDWEGSDLESFSSQLLV